MDTAVRQPAESESDAALVEAASAGHQQAYRELYQRHASWLHPLLWRLCGGQHAQAEDLLQEAFVQAWFKLDQLRQPERFGSWLKRTAINLLLTDRRRLTLVDNDASLPDAAGLQPPWPGADLDLECQVARLPARARQVLVLFCMEGFSHEEIATLMKIEVGTSKAQLHRARLLLKEALA
jgi:RNA polymerase sigma factor (sigma-70 family)